jgi:hypothetical protein
VRDRVHSFNLTPQFELPRAWPGVQSTDVDPVSPGHAMLRSFNPWIHKHDPATEVCQTSILIGVLRVTLICGCPVLRMHISTGALEIDA